MPSVPTSAAAAAAAALALAAVAHALDPAPVALRPGSWLGIDGNWSTVSFLLGSESELVNVLVSTTLSEFWAVGPGGCAENETHCITARGGIYNSNKSSHWSPMGSWQLGLQHLGLKADGDYGLDVVNAYSPITDIAFGMANVLMSVINTTTPFLGLFGLGIQQGRFGAMVAESPLTQAVKTFGWIPSYSYGYTAGAHYHNAVVSATLGGYDAARFVPHDITFTLAQGESAPHALVRGIQVTANNSLDKPGPWNSTTEILSDWSGAFTAVIDSSTPFLWLPESICHRFAKVLGLNYNSTLDAYTMADQLYRDYTSKNTRLMTFSLTSFDNHDDFGLPLQVPGLVNVTLTLQAFIGLLKYPFGGGAVGYGDPAVPYFMLRRAINDTFVIGRSFLQETYLVSKFDEAVFSVHQALFPLNPERDAKLVPIKRPSNSPYPPPPKPDSRKGLTTGQMVGIAVGVALLCALVLAGYCCYRRRRRSRRVKDTDKADDNKDSSSTVAPDSPKSSVSRIISKIIHRKQSRPATPDATDAPQLPSEAPDCEIYELPAPLPPVELDAGIDGNSLFGEAELGTDKTHQLSAYEIARRRLDRQLRGPVPQYTPPAESAFLPPEKAFPYLRPLAANQVTDQPSPISPARSGSNSFQPGEPSPMTPRAEWDVPSAELVSPATASASSEPWSGGNSSRGGQTDLASRCSTAQGEVPAAPTVGSLHASFQRTPIDPSRVVCLGPLPENLQLQRQSMFPHVVGDGQGILPVPMFSTTSLPSEGSLGSNYTEEEERIVEEIARQVNLSRVRSNQAEFREPSDEGGQDQSRLFTWPAQDEESAHARRRSGSEPAASQGRIDPGKDLVHVPQMAEKRYSWEDER